MTVLTGGPALHAINAGLEAEHQDGVLAGLSGTDYQVPSDLQDLSLFPDGPPNAAGRALSKRRAAWSRGWAKGRIRFLHDRNHRTFSP